MDSSHSPSGCQPWDAEAVAIRRLAAAVGIRGPSVNKHVPAKAAVEDAPDVPGARARLPAMGH